MDRSLDATACAASTTSRYETLAVPAAKARAVSRPFTRSGSTASSATIRSPVTASSCSRSAALSSVTSSARSRPGGFRHIGSSVWSGSDRSPLSPRSPYPPCAPETRHGRRPGTVDMVKLRIGRGEIEHAPVLPVSLRAEGRTRTTVAISPSVAASRPNRSFSTSLTGFPYRKAGRRTSSHSRPTTRAKPRDWPCGSDQRPSGSAAAPRHRGKAGAVRGAPSHLAPPRAGRIPCAGDRPGSCALRLSNVKALRL